MREPLPSIWKFPSSPSTWFPFHSTSLLHFPQMQAPSYSHSSSRPPFLHQLLSPSPPTPSLISPHSLADKLPVPSRLYQSHTCSSSFFLTNFFSKGFICCCKKCQDLFCESSSSISFWSHVTYFQILPTQPPTKEDDVPGTMEWTQTWRQSPALPYINEDA